jgi:hypothetical protein
MLRKTATPKIPINTLSIQRELTTEVMRAVIKYEYKMSVDPNNNIEIGSKILSELRAPRTQTLRQTAGTDQRSTVQPATFREYGVTALSDNHIFMQTLTTELTRHAGPALDTCRF